MSKGLYSSGVETYDTAEAAERTGIPAADLTRMVELGIIEPDGPGEFTGGNLRKIGVVNALMAAGIPLDGLGAAIRQGRVSLDFLDASAFERFSAASGVTFAEMAERTGVPIEQLLFIREAAGSSSAAADRSHSRGGAPLRGHDRARRCKAGMRPAAIQQMLRSQADGMRRVAETESAIWQSEVIGPAMASGKRPDEVLGGEFGDRMSAADRARRHRHVPHAADAGLDDQHHRGPRGDAGGAPACTPARSTRRRCASSTSAATRA